MKPWAALILLVLVGCGGNGNQPVNTPPKASPAIQRLRSDALALQLREDLGAPQVHVQCIHIGVGLEAHRHPALTMIEAEELAAKVYEEALTAEDWDHLVYLHSWEPPRLGTRPGVYRVVRGKDIPGTGFYAEENFSLNLRRAFWRLKPGEIGAVEYHRTDNDAGYFILRRLTDEEVRADDPKNSNPTTPQVAEMRERAQALMARPELPDEIVKVQHCLIGRYAPGPRQELKPLKAVQAEELAAELFAKALAGEDFDSIVKQHTYDSPPGIYTLSRAEGVDDALFREGMVAGFWQAAWRLRPGEIGIVPYDPQASPYGYHIIKRLE